MHIIGTAGMATPIVVGGAVAGGGTIAFGVSDAVEGAQDINYGINGNIDTQSINGIRDTLFKGNQQAYNITENAFAFTSSAMVPIAAAERAGNLTFRSASVIVTRLAVSDAAGSGAQAATMKFTGNRALSMFAGMTASTLTGYGLNTADTKVQSHYHGKAEETFNDLANQESWNTPQNRQEFLDTFDDYAQRAVDDGAVPSKAEFYKQYSQRDYHYPESYVNEVKKPYLEEGASSVVNEDAVRSAFDKYGSVGRGKAGNFSTSIVEDNKLCFGEGTVASPEQVATVKGVDTTSTYRNGMFQYEYDSQFVKSCNDLNIVNPPNGTTPGASSLNIPGSKTWSGHRMDLSESEMMMPSIVTDGYDSTEVFSQINQRGYFEMKNPQVLSPTGDVVQVKGSFRIVKWGTQ